MGDQAENSRALEDVLGSIFPRHEDEHHPKLTANQLPDGIEYLLFTGSLLAALSAGWVRYNWRGYRLTLHPDSAGDAVLNVVFGGVMQSDTSGNVIVLRPGEYMDVPRGFTHVWLKLNAAPTMGVVPAVVIEVTRVPLLDVRHAMPIMAASPLNVAGPPGSWLTGKQTAPAAGTVIADTGALNAGDYELRALACASALEGLDNDIELQHRDAANAVTIKSLVLPIAPNMPPAVVEVGRFTLAAGERIRLVNVLAGSAGCDYSASIWRRRVA
jgi:hypothetical protein